MNVQSVKKRNTPVHSNTNNRRIMKLAPIIMDSCLLKLDALKFFLGNPSTMEGSLPNFGTFSM